MLEGSDFMTALSGQVKKAAFNRLGADSVPQGVCKLPKYRT